MRSARERHLERKRVYDVTIHLKTYGHCRRRLAMLGVEVAKARQAFAETGLAQYRQRIADLRVQMSVWRGIAARIEREDGVGL